MTRPNPRPGAPRTKPTARKRKSAVVPWTPCLESLVLRRPLTRLVALWCSDADNQGLLHSRNPYLKGYGEGRHDCLRRCADQLERALKP